MANSSVFHSIPPLKKPSNGPLDRTLQHLQAVPTPTSVTMKFGKRLEREAISHWRPHYLRYNLLKKKIKELNERVLEEDVLNASFNELLEEEVYRIQVFYSRNLMDLRSRLEALEAMALKATTTALPTGPIADTTTKPTAPPDVDRSVVLAMYTSFGRDVVLLFCFVELNLEGLRKIIKKFDKRTCTTSTFLKDLKQDDSSALAIALAYLKEYSTIAPLVNGCAMHLENELLHTHTNDYEVGHGSSTLHNKGSRLVLSQLRGLEHRCKEVNGYLSFLSSQALIGFPMTRQGSEFMEEQMEVEEHVASQFVNLLSTFFYILNYNMCLPTAAEYSQQLGMHKANSGVIVAMTPLAALLGAFVYSYLSSFSYKTPLLMSNILLIAGNLAYALAWDYGSIPCLLLGRFVTGLGGCRAINRRYIADNVSEVNRTHASSLFVAASAVGMACGPLSAVFFEGVDTKLFGYTFNEVTAPGFAMVFIWVAFGLLVLFVFKEPPRRKSDGVALDFLAHRDRFEDSSNENDTEEDDFEVDEDGLLRSPRRRTSSERAPLLSNGSPGSQNGRSYGTLSRQRSISSGKKRRNYILSIVCLWILFYAKLVQEALLTSIPLMAPHFYSWTTSNVGLFLALLGLLVVPSNLLLAMAAKKMELKDVSLIKILVVLLTLGLFVMIPLTSDVMKVAKLCLASVLIYSSANALEGIVLSLFSKVISARLATGTFNSGFLATEAGTFGRSCGNALISLLGVNGTFALQYNLYGVEFVVCVGTLVFIIFMMGDKI